MFFSRMRWPSGFEGKTRKTKRSSRDWVKPRLEALEDRTLLSVQIQFDYSHDPNGFFAQNPQAKAILQQAANDLTSHFTNSLQAIQATGPNTWTAQPFDPANPFTGTLNLQNLVVPQDTLIIYVGGANLPAGSELGVGGPGGYSDSGTQGFLNTVASRGQSGFTTWGGSISFQMNAPWYFGSSASVPAGQADFYSVATHELGHVLGIGDTHATQWTNQIQGTNFVGPNAEAAYGGPVPLDQTELQNLNGHWAQGVMSTTPGGAAQQAAMDPSIPLGTRDYFTTLDFAGLQDLGWQTTPITNNPTPTPPSGNPNPNPSGNSNNDQGNSAAAPEPIPFLNAIIALYMDGIKQVLQGDSPEIEQDIQTNLPWATFLGINIGNMVLLMGQQAAQNLASGNSGGNGS